MKLFVPCITNHSKRNDFCKLGYGVMVVTLDFGSESPGSSPGSPTISNFNHKNKKSYSNKLYSIGN